jgi:hypothetical protein
MMVHLTQIFRSNKDKEGQPLMTKGTPNKPSRPYTRVAIKTKEHGEAWISGFESYYNVEWREGDAVDIDIEKKGEYLNFSKPDPLKVLTARVDALEKALQTLKTGQGEVVQVEDDGIPTIDSIPF